MAAGARVVHEPRRGYGSAYQAGFASAVGDYIVMIDADRTDEDSVMLAAAEGGADDVTKDGDSFEVTTSPEALSSVREALEQAGIEVESAETTMVPKTTIELDQEAAARKTLRLIDELEELDDVNEVYANFDIPERLLETVAG